MEHQFAGSYHAVRLVLRHHGAAAELPFRRMECEAGQELQVDFGQGAWVIENGKRRRPHLFRAILSCSRKGCPVHSDAKPFGTIRTLVREVASRPLTSAMNH